MVRATAREATSARAPLTRELAIAIAARWTHGGYADLAEAAIDIVAKHIRDAGIAAVDPRLGEAIADAIARHVERDAPAPSDPHQLTLFDQVEGGELAIGGAP